MFGVQPLAELFGDFLIVEVGEREMRVAFDTDVGQHHELGIAAVTVDHSSKEVSHFRCCPPVVVVRMCGHVVAVENHDGKARELQQAIF